MHFEESEYEFLERMKKTYHEERFFLDLKLGAEMHWFFQQALQCHNSKFFLPACVTFINGIEASMRITVRQLDEPSKEVKLDPHDTLSNRLLLKAKKQHKLPIELLKFSDENDFDLNLNNGGNKEPVKIVRTRHNLCHGNILEFINDDLGEDNRFFTPECLRELSNELYLISKRWAVGLSDFRRVNFQGGSEE